MFRELVLVALAVSVLAPTAAAHHSRAAYDMTQEIVVEGTVAALAWKNPHIFMTVETKSPDGESYRVEIEVTSVSEAPVLGLTKEAIAPGARVAVRAHPGRGGPRTRAVGLVVTTGDGTVYPLNTDARLAIRAATVPARGIAGRWAPTLESFNGVMAATRSWPLTEAGRVASAQAASQVQLCRCCRVGDLRAVSAAHSFGFPRCAHHRGEWRDGVDALRGCRRPAHGARRPLGPGRASCRRRTVADGPLDRAMGGRDPGDRHRRLLSAWPEQLRARAAHGLRLARVLPVAGDMPFHEVRDSAAVAAELEREPVGYP